MLILGLTVFFAIHLLPAFPTLRNALHAGLGANIYKAIFGLVSFAGLALIVMGMRSAERMDLWSPPYEARTITSLAMVAALYCFVSMMMRTNLNRLTAHPMNWGVALWAAGHLASNGDVASLLLFGSFAGYALFDIYSANQRGARAAGKKVPLRNDAIALVIGSIIFIVMVMTHDYFAGASLM